MIQIEQLKAEGKAVQGTMIVAPGGDGHPNMIIVQGSKGYLMCGYLNLAAAESPGRCRARLIAAQPIATAATASHNQP